MKTAILEKQLQKFSDALSELNDAFRKTQDNFIPGPNEPDIQCRRLLEGINDDLSDANESVCGIGEKVVQLKALCL